MQTLSEPSFQILYYTVYTSNFILDVKPELGGILRAERNFSLSCDFSGGTN
jgi:hypothetical protein